MAKVLTGISGNVISAASAAFAPTNSADVSAIASAYQVVSATATQLYAGTAYVTSVNDAPLSASRAGNAANASLANSAWYDGTGRLISALPDSAAVSAIASAYAESAASGKQDELTFSYDDDKISAINGSSLAGQGGTTGDYLSAVSVDSNLTGDGTTASAIGLNTQIALDGTSSYIRLTNSAATVPTFAQMVSNATNGMISVSGNKANIQATGKATANFSFNCDTSGQASMLSGPWLSTKYWAGVSSYYKNGTAAITVRASGSNNPTITLDGADGNSVIYLSSIPYWNAKLDESAVSGKADSSALSSYVPYSSLEYNTASAISGINGSALAAGSTYSAGEGIDITNNEISVDYDTNTLDVTGQAVTENVTQQSSSGLFLLPSSVAALLSQQTNTQVTVHIPANMLRDVNYDYSEEPSITFRFTLYATDSTSETNVSLFSTALSWENYDGEYGLIDEQDIVFNLPASVANQWSQSLSSAVAFSICGQRSSMPATSAPVELFGDLSTDPITFTFVDASATKLAVKNPLPSSTSADEGKCLVVDSNGDPEWGTGGKTYTGTDGVVVDNVNDTVGLEAPVDIVAGPGIVIDNPDGNTVRVSTNADSFFKELYYNATNVNDTAGKVYSLSEPITNFMYAKITVDNMEYTNAPLVYEIDVQHNTTTCQWNSPLRNGNRDNTINLPTCQLKIDASGNLVLAARGLTYNTYPSPMFTNGDNRGMRVVRVVGIFRIAGGN